MSFIVFTFRMVAATVTRAFAVSSALLLCAFTSIAGEPAKSEAPASSGNTPDLSTSPNQTVKFPDRSLPVGDMFSQPRMDAMPLPPPRVYVPSRRARQMRDDRENWAFLSPDEIIRDYVSKQGLSMPEYGLDGRERSSLSAVERFYDRQAKARPKIDSADHADSFVLFGDAHSLEIKSGLDSLYGTDRRSAMRGFASGPASSDSLSDILGFKNNPVSAEAIREREAQDRQMEAFKQALDFQQPPVVAGTLNPYTATMLTSPSASGTKPNNNSSVIPWVQKNPYDAAAGTYNSSLAVAAPTAPIAPTAPVAPGQPLSSILPSTPSRIAPPKPDFSIPQRRF